MENFYFTSRQNHFSNSSTNLNRKILRKLKTVGSYCPKLISVTKYNKLQSEKQRIQKDKNLLISISHLAYPIQNSNVSRKSSHQPIQRQQTFIEKGSMQNKFRNTISFMNWTKSGNNYDLKKRPNRIEIIMKQKKKLFSTTIRQNISKLNSSYINCIQDSLKTQFARKNQQRLSEQQSMNIQMDTKSNKNIIFTGGTGFNSHKSVQKHNSEDTFIKENNLFSISIEPKKCMNGIFPMFRSGHTLCSIGTSVYLFGGINSKLANSYHFNEFIGSSKEWVCLKNQTKLNIIPSFHSVQTFRNSLIFIGGSSINQKNNKRLLIPDILIYDTTKKQFSKLRWNTSLRSHASTIYSNMLVIYGGIDQNNQLSNILYFIPLNTSNINQTNPIPYDLGPQGQGIAHHKMVNTFDVDYKLKKKLALDGIICYGGKFADGRVNSEILLFRFNRNKESSQTQGMMKGWQTVKVHGAKPQARYCHSMDILYKKCICLVIGGMNSDGKALNDAWILDLVSSVWVKAIFNSKYQILQRGIFSHATTVMNGQLFVFGGLNGENKISNEFWSMDFAYNRAAKKQEQLKKLSAKQPTLPILQASGF